MTIIRRLLGFLRPFTGQVLLSILLGVATIAGAIGLLGTSADLIARAALHPSIAALQVAIVGVRFFGISRAVFRYLERLVSHSVNFRLLAQLRTWFYQAVEPLAPARLTDYQGGDLLSRAVGDIETLENFYVRAVAPPLVASLVSLGMSLFVGGFHPALGLLLAGGLLVSGIGVPVVTRILARQPGRRLVAERARLSAAVVDGLQGLPELLLYNRTADALDLIQQTGRAMGASQLRLTWAGALANALNLGLMLLTLVGVLWLAIPLVAAAELPGVLLAVLVQLTLASFEAVLPLAGAAQHLESALEAGRRLFTLAAE
ncbi:MAG TPA: ABC transporter transmembrane domain-containing protein, partial [Anaerolineaceae bacterium]|nr:ABC transporter transmembrane domain-containing protein [Anaerolineaceae bacterium]